MASRMHSKCKECGTEYALEASYVCEQCFGPLEVAYDYSGLDAAEREAQDPGRPARRSGATPTSCRSTARPHDRARAGPDAAGPRRAARRAARPGRGLGQERRRQPDPLVQGPGRRRRARQGARARLRDGRLRLDRQPRQRGRRPRRRRRPRVLRLRPGRPRGAEDPRDRRLRHQPRRRRRQLRRRQPALHRALRRARPWAFVNVNLRPYYAEGSKTLAFEIAEQLGWSSCPTASSCPIASGSLFTKIGRGFEEWLELGLVEGELPTFNGAQAEGCSRSRRRSRTGTTSAGRSAPDTIAKSSRSATRPTAPTRSSSRARTGGAIDVGHRRGDRRGHPAARRDDRHLHRDRRRRHDRRPGQARRARRHRPGRAGRRSTSPARA